MCADIIAVLAIIFLAGISMEHNAVTGLTAQDSVKEASIARILRIIAPYAVTRGGKEGRDMASYMKTTSTYSGQGEKLTSSGISGIPSQPQPQLLLTPIQKYNQPVAGNDGVSAGFSMVSEMVRSDNVKDITTSKIRK